MAFTYLASPYSHAQPKVRQERYIATRDWIANHMRVHPRSVIYSPIVHFHDLARANKFDHSFEFWSHINIEMIRAASQFWVLKLKGYDTSVGIFGDNSKGILGELDIAQQFNKPVKFIEA